MRARSLHKGVFVGLVVALLTAGAGAQPTPRNDPAGNDPAGGRSMAFEPGLGEAAQERVPGGRLVAMAYGFALLAIGGYVAFVARGAAKLEVDVRELEDALARRGDGAP
ncbi:MAG: hypothetical protein JWM10_1755 [Myxococcaceae bacterium]|nr:hypothetical protein [Myxococcaceae bacterium]